MTDTKALIAEARMLLDCNVDADGYLWCVHSDFLRRLVADNTRLAAALEEATAEIERLKDASYDMQRDD